jgi:hypothetical protein
MAENILGYDPRAAQQQALWQGLLGLGSGLIAAGAPSTDPGASGRGIGQALQMFQGGMTNAKQQAMQDYLAQAKMQEVQQGQEARKKMTDYLATLPSSEVNDMLKNMDPGQAQKAWADLAVARERARLGMDGNGPTMAIKDYQHFKALPPEDQQLFMLMKRGPSYQDLGFGVAAMMPGNPTVPATVMQKGLAPGELPTVRGQQAAATAAGQAQGTQAGDVGKKATEARNTLGMLDGVESIIDTATGSLAGTGRDAVAGSFGVATEGAKAAAKLKVIQNNLVLTMPKLTGPTSDRDTALYKEATGLIGDPTIPAEIKKSAVGQIRQIQEKYNQAGGSPAIAGQAEIEKALNPLKKPAGGSGVIKFDANGNMIR